MRKHLCIAASLVTALLAASLSPSYGQSYPARPIKLIVPVSPGSLTDVIARRFGAEMEARMGQPWIMENRPGGNFIRAAEVCKQAQPDGYTLCVFTTSTFSFNPHLIAKLPYDPDKDFKPIINLGFLLGGLVGAPSLPARSFEELRAFAVARPGALNFGTYGAASSANVFRQYLADRWQTSFVEVPYKGANELVLALVSGELHLTWTAVGNWADNPDERKGRIFAIDGVQRSPVIAHVPTYAEVGIRDYPIRTWMGLFAPSGVPDAVIARVNAEAGQAISGRALTDFLTRQMIEPAISTPQAFAAFLGKERDATGQLIRKFNIPPIQ